MDSDPQETTYTHLALTPDPDGYRPVVTIVKLPRVDGGGYVYPYTVISPYSHPVDAHDKHHAWALAFKLTRQLCYCYREGRFKK